MMNVLNFFCQHVLNNGYKMNYVFKKLKVLLTLCYGAHTVQIKIVHYYISRKETTTYIKRWDFFFF